jgi:hypothetical protein
MCHDSDTENSSQRGDGYARKTAGSLENEGDHEGHEIWNEVADIIDRRQSNKVSRRSLEIAVQ